MSISEELIRLIPAKLGKRLLCAEKVAIGVPYTAVRLESGQAGVAFTPVREIPQAALCPRSASRMPAAGRLAGQGALRYRIVERAIGPGTPLRQKSPVPLFGESSQQLTREAK